MAIKAQDTALRMETARGAAKTITGITAANPPVVTSTSHGITNGQIVYIDGVVGMTQLNGRAFVAANVAASTLELKGVDATGYTAYASGGSAYVLTMTEIAEVTGLAGFDGQASEIDVTNLRSTAKEYLLGLQDFGNVSLPVTLRNADAGQVALRKAKASATVKGYSITLSDGAVAAFMAYVRQFTFSTNPDDAAKGQVQLRVTGEPAWFA